MARVRHPNLQNVNGRYLAGATVTAVTDRTDDSPAEAYTAEVGGTTVTYPVTSGAEGQIELWVPPGSYESTFGDDTVDEPAVWEAVVGVDSGEVAGAIDALESATAALEFHEYNVATYGAVGDGTTDDTAAIQAAIDACKVVGGQVLLPIAIYRTTDTLELGDVTSGVDQLRPFTFTGLSKGQGASSGRGSTIRYDPTTPTGAGPAIRAASGNGIELCYMNVEYTATGFDGDLIDFEGQTQTGDVNQCHIHHITTSAVGARSCRSILRFWRAIISWVDHCHFSGADGQGIRIHDNQYCVGINISHCTFNSNDSEHILLASADCENVTIDNCVFEAGVSTTAIRGGLTASGESVLNNNYNLQISNNWFGDAGDTTLWITDLRSATTGTIINNRMYHAGAAGIYFDLADGPWTLIANGCQGSSGGTDSIFGDASGLTLTMIGNTASLINSAWTTPPGSGYYAVGNVAPWPVDSLAAEGSLILIGDGSPARTVAGTEDGTLVVGQRASLLTSVANRAFLYTLNRDDVVIQAPSGNTKRIILATGTTPTQMLTANGTGIAFHGQTPAARPDYTVTNPSTDRAFDVSTAAAPELAAVLGTLISDLIAIGLLQ